MVGASELAFQRLCHKYGAQLAYTPMMSVTTFSSSQEYQAREFYTIPEDRPLVCHFLANYPTDFAWAAKLAEPHCDAVDLNLEWRLLVTLDCTYLDTRIKNWC
jgi:tRNA-dihydrouridine synthase